MKHTIHKNQQEALKALKDSKKAGKVLPYAIYRIKTKLNPPGSFELSFGAVGPGAINQ